MIGLGNLYRGDDQLGLLAARQVREHGPPDLEVIEHSLDPMDLLDIWSGADTIIVLDTVSSGATPGFVHRLEASCAPLPSSLRSISTHALGLAALVELARTLEKLPRRLVVYGIEGESYEPGSEPTPRCLKSVSEVVSRVLRELTCTRSQQVKDGRLHTGWFERQPH